MSLSMCRCIGDTLNIYKNKDGNTSTKNIRHVEANVNKQKENQNHQINNNEVEDIMLKRYLLPQIN
jgi:hypothetical protein